MDFKNEVEEILNGKDTDKLRKLLRLLKGLPDGITKFVNESINSSSSELKEQTTEQISSEVQNVLSVIESLNSKLLEIKQEIELAKEEIYKAIEASKADVKDGYTPVKGKDYKDGEPGYTPIKGKDYFDGEPGKPGYTPKKGLVINEGGYGDADADFRAETDSNPNAFVVDASADEINIGVDTYFTAGGLPYGSMYIYNLGAGALTITVSAADTWYEIGSGVTGGTTNLITFQNNHELLVTKAGTYKIDWALSLESAAANQEVEGTIMVNGTANTSFAGMAELAVANRTNLISGTGIVTLNANDLISLAVLNHTATQNIKIDHLTLSVVMVGG